jgi:hypothetical protein
MGGETYFRCPKTNQTFKKVVNDIYSFDFFNGNLKKLGSLKISRCFYV